MATSRFDYTEAFDRNIGWVTEWEQQVLRHKRVAIAGMGGVGGVHLMTLTRLGIGGFSIADLDTFDLVNFNRQVGASLSTVGRPKVEVMRERALDINPELDIRVFPEGVSDANVDAFLEGVDLFVDGFDFFVLGIRSRVFARCAELGIPAITAAPIGMGTGYLVFLPGQMSFEQYFRLEGQPEVEQYLRFLMGVAPLGLHRSYLVDPSRINLAAKKGPSTAAACELCAGVTATAALKLLLRRGDVRAAPYHHHFEAYRGRLAITRLPQGNRTPRQRLRLALARRMLAGLARPAPVPMPARAPAGVLDEILSLARWAPSGDNEQPWQFEVDGEDAVTVHLQGDTGNIYDYRDGEPTLLSGGMLVETLRLAASLWGRGMEWAYAGGNRVRVTFASVPGLKPDPLAGQIILRSVDRRPFRRRPLTGAEKTQLAAAAAPLAIEWHEGDAARRRFTRLGAMATDIRLRAPEAFRVHQSVIDWTRRHSPTGIPAAATGLARASLPMMRWAMQRWERMERMNKAGGTVTAALQLDTMPGLFCAGFFAMRMARDWAGPEERAVRLLEAGAALQRFWLTANRLGLSVQPNLATLIFAQYGESGAAFTADARLLPKADRLARRFKEVLGSPDAYVFLGRIGETRPGARPGRSVRQPLAKLMRGSNG